MRGGIDQRPAYSAPPRVRLDEEAIELAADDRGEAGNPAVEVGDKDIAPLDLS